MKQNKIKGFTLIELLAVIVILAIIALIAVPVIMNIINKANESAFKDTAYGVISAGELYYAEQLLEPNGMTSDVTIALPDTTKRLQIKGEVPNGTILITTEGKIAIAVQNGRYCVTKGLEDDKVTMTEDIANCNLPSVEEEPEENTPQAGSIKTLATTSTEVPEKPVCLTDGTICAPGTPVAIKVNETDVYNFYVISDASNEVTLLMDRNLYSETDDYKGNVAWISASEYSTANSEEGDNTRCNFISCNDEGPITAVSALKERTSSWSNIPERVYTYSDDGGGNKYTAFTETMRARMLTYTEANNIRTANNNTLPSWMLINLATTGDSNTHGYWLSAATASSPAHARVVYFTDIINDSDVRIANDCGLRPVITLTK